MIPLRLNKRRDGSLCLTDADGRAAGKDREFPTPHHFSHEWLLANSANATMSGDTLQLELANARATYRITDRPQNMVTAELVDSELFDAPPIDEDKAAEIAAQVAAERAANPQPGDGGASIAMAGSVVVEEGDA